MKSLRTGIVASLVLMSALAMVSVPAFATPNLTASSGTAAVAPFFTPISNSNSQRTFRGANVSIAVPALAVTITCRESWGSGYADTTHTNFRYTSHSFNGCTIDVGGGTVDNNGTITCGATTVAPWLLTISSVNAATRSAVGSLSIPANGAGVTACSFTFTRSGSSYTVTVNRGQSCLPGARGSPNTYTWATSRVQMTCSLSVTIVGAIVVTTTATYSSGYTLRPDTARDGTLVVTAAS